MNAPLWIFGTPSGLICLGLGLLIVIGVGAYLVGGVYLEREPKEPLVQDEWWASTQF